MSRIFEYFVVCGIGPEIRTYDGSKGYHGTGVMYLPSLLDQYPPPNHTLYPPPPPQLPTVSTSAFSNNNNEDLFLSLRFFFSYTRFVILKSSCVLLRSCIVFSFQADLIMWAIVAFQCVLPAGVEFHSSGFDSNDPSTFPRSYPIVLTGMLVCNH